MKREFAAVRADIAKLAAQTRADIAKVTSTVGELAAETRKEFASVRADITKLTTLSQRMFSRMTHVEDKVDDMSRRMVTRDEFNTRFDTAANRLGEIDFRLASHLGQLKDHEKRITRLETD